MSTFRLGRFSVARVGYGAMQLTGPGVFGPPASRDDAIAVLRTAVEIGVNHIDTAEYYGPRVVNELIQEALHPYPGGLAIVSKVGARRDDAGAVLPYDQPDELRRGIEDNLRTLRVDRLAAVNLRLMDDSPPDGRFDAQLAAMVTARDEGLIDGIGLSNVSLAHLRRALAVTEIVCVQNSFSLLDRASTSVLQECARRGIAFVPYVPLGWPRDRREAIFNNPAVDRLARLHHATPAQIALAWLLALSPNVLLIPGTASLRHLRENLAVDRIELDRDAMNQLDSAFA
ncbi:oxidoreductase [Micromonospora sp. NPDC051006]|uniref:oxidoreductase n=1 Tax=Micromonospora sp. NPDC051006 TaxID=3364283 RepID=UPI0037AA88A0